MIVLANSKTKLIVSQRLHDFKREHRIRQQYHVYQVQADQINEVTLYDEQKNRGHQRGDMLLN